MSGLRARTDRIVEGLDDRRTAGLMLLAAIALYLVVVLLIGHNEGIFVDESNYFDLDRGLDPYALLSPLNGHLVLFPRLVYAANFALFGGEFLGPRLVMAVGAALAVWLFFGFAFKRVGGTVALGLSLLLLFFGTAWEANFIQSGITYAWCLAAGIGALILLERDDRRSDAVGCALLVVSVASVTFGVAFVAAAIALLIARPRGRRAPWVVLVPILLFAAWFIWLHTGFDGEIPDRGDVFNLLRAPAFFANEASATAGALSGLNYDFAPGADVSGVFTTTSPFGPLLAVALGVAIVLRLRRRPVSPMLWALLVALAATWLALVLGYWGFGGPDTARYTYIGGALILMIAVEACRGTRPQPPVKAAIFVLCGLAIAGNLARLRDAADVYRDFSSTLRAQLTALELARDSVDPAFGPGAPAASDAIKAGPYLAAVDRIGETGYAESTIGSLSEGSRATIDATLVGALRIAPSPASKETGGTGCETREPVGGVVEQTATPPGLTVSSGAAAQLAIRRFADTATQPLGALEAGEQVSIELPEDRSDQPWVVVVSGLGATLTTCPG
jgi:hypothetical protein